MAFGISAEQRTNIAQLLGISPHLYQTEGHALSPKDIQAFSTAFTEAIRTRIPLGEPVEEAPGRRFREVSEGPLYGSCIDDSGETPGIILNMGNTRRGWEWADIQVREGVIKYSGLTEDGKSEYAKDTSTAIARAIDIFILYQQGTRS